MNVEDRIHSSSSSSSESERDSSRNSSRKGQRASDEPLRENYEEIVDSARSEDSGDRNVEVSSSIATESEEIPRNIATDSSSVLTDIEITSPKDDKSSSSADEELLRKFREQQANRRFRPTSAKVKYKKVVEPEPETVQTYHSRDSDRESNVSSSSTSTVFSSRERSDSAPRKSDGKHKQSNSLSSNSTLQKQKSQPSESSSSDATVDFNEKLRPRKHRKSPKSKSSNSSSSSTSNDQPTPVQQSDIKPKPDFFKASKHKRKSSDSQKFKPKIRPPQLEERPPSRQERRRDPTESKRVGRTRTRSKPAKNNVDELLRKKSKPIPTNPRENWPREPGFWWPYNEDRGERGLQRLISYHRRKLNNLLAQEYLQRHLEIELKKAGAQFARYERPPRSLSPKQAQRYKERDISWIYLDGNLYNVNADIMGSFIAKNKNDGQSRKTRSGSRSLERSSKSSERSKRSVSFEKGAGRRRKAGKKSSKKKKGRKGLGSRSSSKDSRRSSLSSRESSRQSRDSSKSSKREYGRGERSRSGSRSRSLSSSKSSGGSKRSPSKTSTTDRPPRPKTALSRPKTAKPKLRSLSSASRSSAETSNSKKMKNRSSSSSGNERKSKSRDSSRKCGNKTNKIDDSTTLERVLFTEEFEKKLKRKEHQMRKHKKESTSHTQIPTLKDTDQSDNENQNIKADKRAFAGNQRAPRSDYDFYRDPNIPGHAFPHYYLAQLLSSQNTGRKKRHESTRYVLLPAPVNRPPAWKKYPTRSGRTQRKNPPVSGKSSKPRKKKTKSIINQVDKAERSSDDSSSSSSRSSSPAPGSHPRIQPGSGPIKCSWKAQNDPDKPKFAGSDHQLKNTDNPAILSWLKRKDAQHRARRQDEMRTQRRKTAKLIDEQNDLEDQHERALQQYEIWKKNKDREILLRRRKEAKEANSASFSRREDGPSHVKRAGAQTAHPYHHASGGSTFSELRSSSARPATAEPTRRKARPKSAHVVGMTTSGHRDKPRPTSATLPRSDTKRSEASQSLFESVLEDGSRNEISNNSYRDKVEDDERQMSRQATQEENKAAYNKWVRSAHSDNRKRRERKSKKRNSTRPLPPHNHTDNELISKLAKRRIDIILANKKSVDTGLNRRPASAKSKSAKSTGSDSTHRKWKLRDDNVIKPAVTFAPGKKNSSSSSSGDERVKFSYRKKSPASPSRHERNPVVREAMN